MKKNLFLIALVLLCLGYSSCTKKDQQLPSTDNKIDSSKLQALVSKYNLKPTKTAPQAWQRNFDNIESLEKFLENNHKEGKLKPSATAGASGLSGATGGVTTYTYPSSQVIYSAQLNMPALQSVAFPSYFVLSWLNNAIVSFNLYIPGSNYGSYAFNPTVQTVSGSNILVKGIYMESYGVGGVYTYEKFWDFKFTATYSSTSITATASFTPRP
jgi:hypothetical protein